MNTRRQRISKIIISSVIAVALLGALKLGVDSLLLEMKAKSTLHVSYAIFGGLYAMAHHNDDKFPNTNFDGTTAQTSNDAFRQLFIKGLADDERLFYVQGSAWHAGKQQDGNIGTKATNFGEAVSKNENHWAYVSGLNAKTSAPESPLLMDGCSETVGVWSDDPSKKGGIWKGRYLIVIRVTGSSQIHHLKYEQDFQTKVMNEIQTTPGAKLLNPDG